MENRPNRVTKEKAVGIVSERGDGGRGDACLGMRLEGRTRSKVIMTDNYCSSHSRPGTVLCILYELSHLILLFTIILGALNNLVL